MRPHIVSVYLYSTMPSVDLEAPGRALKAYLAAERLTIPVLPAVAIEMLRLYKDPDANAREMAELIQRDQSLVGSVIRVCNSAAYGGVRPITSLHLAIARLGIRVLGRIAVAHIVRGRVFSAYAHEQEMAAVWAHAQLTALLADEIARLGRADPEEAYLCGLLHTIGRPMVYQALDDLKNRGEIEMDLAEETRLAEAFYSEVGYRVSVEWALPAGVTAACRFHRDPESAPAESAQVVAIVHLAGRMAGVFLNPGLDTRESLAESPSVARLGLPATVIPALFEQSEALVLRAENMAL